MKQFYIVYGGPIEDVYQQSDLTIEFAHVCTLDDMPEVIINHHKNDDWIKIVEAELPDL